MTRPEAASAAFLSLGSNLGDRRRHLREAVQSLKAQGVRVLQCSSLYETEPEDYLEQPYFLNAVCRVSCRLAPLELLALCLDIERSRGRERRIAKGPRTLDLDLLFYEDLIIQSRRLTLPHPALQRRRFVLLPLAEIAPAVLDPSTGRSVGELLEACPAGSTVRKIEGPTWCR